MIFTLQDTYDGIIQVAPNPQSNPTTPLCVISFVEADGEGNINEIQMELDDRMVKNFNKAMQLSIKESQRMG